MMKPESTDLNALDLRDKLLALTGVDGVIYDQAAERLRIDFAVDVTAAQRQAAVDAAKADKSVESVSANGSGAGSKAPQQQPQPGVASPTS